MPLAPVALVVGAALLGAVLGWWPLAAWTDRNIRRDPTERMPLRALRAWSAGTTALLFGLLTWRYGLDPVLPALLALAAAGVALSIVDLTEKRLPNAMVFPTLLVVAVLLVPASALTGDWLALAWAAAGSAGMFLFYFVLALISPKAMGMGDVKFGLPLGLPLGWFGWVMWIAGLFGAFLIGGIVAIVALALRRVTLKGSVPFGPSMVAGAMLALLLLAR
ncbi:prepilin peptidase [Agromyces bracchium]|uniref:Prepilin peptidase n=1 Tax=Agromyces bracchium TaxID=88376 RepID=A0A6I3MJE2_9MICO|nr:prepilin peptidase [Agromyces bracchium]MTH70373.1 prepilin peptidase [Agromyces bracchium]